MIKKKKKKNYFDILINENKFLYTESTNCLLNYIKLYKII